jgi:hypothetical protein
VRRFVALVVLAVLGLPAGAFAATLDDGQELPALRPGEARASRSCPVRPSRYAAPSRFTWDRPGRTPPSSPSTGQTVRAPPGRGSSRPACDVDGCSSAGCADGSAAAASRHTRCSSMGGAPAGFRQSEQSRTSSSPPTTASPSESVAAATGSALSRSTGPGIAAALRVGSSVPSSFQGCRDGGGTPTETHSAAQSAPSSCPASCSWPPDCFLPAPSRAPSKALRRESCSSRRRTRADPAQSRHVRLARRVAPAARLWHRAGEPPLRIRPGDDPAGVHDDPDLSGDRPELLDDAPAERDLLRPLLLAGHARRSPPGVERHPPAQRDRAARRVRSRPALRSHARRFG